MPELPEVEVLRRQLEPAVIGATVTDVVCDDHHRFADARTVAGRRIERLHRRGKYLLFALDDDREAVVHLGMTGQMSLVRPGDAGPRHLRVRLALEQAGVRRELRLADARKFGRFAVVAAGVYTDLPTLARLGPEPLGDDFDRDGFTTALTSRHAAVKAVLLEQRAVAGVGNWIADEVLHAAGIDPSRQASTLTRQHTDALHAALRRIIAAAVDAGGTSFSDYVHADGTSQGGNAANLDCYGRAGEPCMRCGRSLVKAQVAGRGTTWCPRCQR